jgi:hypothetical protein
MLMLAVLLFMVIWVGTPRGPVGLHHVPANEPAAMTPLGIVGRYPTGFPSTERPCLGAY